MDAPQDDQTFHPTPGGQPEGDPRRKRRRRGGRGGDHKGPPALGLAEGAPPPAPVDWKPGERRPDAPRPKREGPPPRREERGRDERGRGERGRDRRPPEGGGHGGRRGPREGGREGQRETPKKTEVAPAAPAAKPGKVDFLEELGGGLLQGVSRSFYLTIKLLPEPLRAPISLGLFDRAHARHDRRRRPRPRPRRCVWITCARLPRP